MVVEEVERLVGGYRGKPQGKFGKFHSQQIQVHAIDAGFNDASPPVSDLGPFPNIRFSTPAKSRTSLGAKSKQLYQRSVSDGNADRMLAFVAEQLAAKPECADVVHDLLAFLAEQMTALNQEKRATVKQFLNDLKDFHDIDTHTLKPKTKLDKFWELEAAEIFAHFRVNKLHLKDSDEEKIRARFQKIGRAHV